MKKIILLLIIFVLNTGLTYSQNHLQFDGVDSYITFGNNSTLGLSSFTLEAWIYPTGTGVSASSGIGGISAIPIITKGRGESGSEGTVTDMNYFIGINPSTMVLSADFEEGASGSQPGRNHPITGTTALNLNQWYHVAATYDDTDWYLYIDGNLEGTLSVGEPCQNLSIQHSAVGSALLSTGVSQGYFEGEIDEVRVWNIARTQQEIQDNMNKEITSVGSGLVSAWNMNEGVGTVVNGVGGISGQIINSNWSWIIGNAWQTATPPSVGDGSVGSPYEIATLENLYWLSQNSAEWDKHYIQTANIDASSTSTWDSGSGFSPIGNLSIRFTGSYNGQDHTIDGLFINRPTTDFAGLIGWTDNAEIENIGVTNVNITSGDWVGGLVGANQYSSPISNCYTTGTVSGALHVGGLVGENHNSTINNSYAITTVNGDDYVGGLVAYHYLSAAITNSYATGSVSSTGSNVGGLVGYHKTGATTINSFWDTVTSGQATSAGGTGKTTDEMKDLETFTLETTVGLTTAWDYETNPNDDSANEDFWDLCTTLNSGYPILSWQNGIDVCLGRCVGGSIIYNTETNKFNFCEDGIWVEK